MANKLQNPTADEQYQRPTPAKEKERPGDRDHRNADHVTELIQRVLMLRFVIVDERIGHHVGSIELLFLETLSFWFRRRERSAS